MCFGPYDCVGVLVCVRVYRLALGHDYARPRHLLISYTAQYRNSAPVQAPAPMRRTGPPEVIDLLDDDDSDEEGELVHVQPALRPLEEDEDSSDAPAVASATAPSDAAAEEPRRSQRRRRLRGCGRVVG